MLKTTLIIYLIFSFYLIAYASIRPLCLPLETIIKKIETSFLKSSPTILEVNRFNLIHES